MKAKNRIKFFYIKDDGGPDSGVKGYFLWEWKPVCSIGILVFQKGSREAYHSHAFNAITWWLSGSVIEEHYKSGQTNDWSRSLIPKITRRSVFHKVFAREKTFALTFRGPWADTWKESRGGKEIVLTHGRKVV